MFPLAFMLMLLYLSASWVVGPWAVFLFIAGLLGGEAFSLYRQSRQEYEAVRQRLLTRETIEQKLSTDQWAVLESRIRDMNCDGFIKMDGVSCMMKLTPENRKKLSELGFTVTSDGKHAGFSGVSSASSSPSKEATTTSIVVSQ